MVKRSDGRMSLGRSQRLGAIVDLLSPFLSFPFLITLLILVNVLPATAQAPTPPPASRPLIFIRSSHTVPAAVAPGELVELFLELHNVGDASAQEIVVSFNSEFFVPETTSSVKTMPGLRPDEHGMVSQTLRAAPGSPGGTHPVVVQLSYEDELGYRYSSSETVGVMVLEPTPTPAPSRPQLLIEKVISQPAELVPGRPFTLALTLRNVGNGPARRVLLTSGAPSRFAPLGSGSVIALPDVQQGTSTIITLTMITSGDAQEGLYTHPLTLDYEDENGDHFSSSQNVALTVGEPPEELKEPMVAPLLITEGYETIPARANPGAPFTLRITLRNVGNAEARRLRVIFGGKAELPFAPLGAGNVKYLPTVPVGQAVIIEQDFIMGGNVGGGAYLVPLTFEYDDPDGQPHTRSEQISLLVEHPLQLEVNFYRPLGEPVVGQPFDLPVEIINVGRARVNVTTAELVAPELEISEGALYLGPLESGQMASLDATAVAHRPGRHELSLTVHYIDDFNQRRVYTHTLAVTVGELPGPKAGPPGGEAEPGRPGEEVKPQRPLLVRIIRGLLGLGSG